jgi:hypothetical protein
LVKVFVLTYIAFVLYALKHFTTRYKRQIRSTTFFELSKPKSRNHGLFRHPYPSFRAFAVKVELRV